MISANEMFHGLKIVGCAEEYLVKCIVTVIEIPIENNIVNYKDLITDSLNNTNLFFFHHIISSYKKFGI